MIRARYRQLALAQLVLFGVVADPRALMDPLLSRIDALLDDEEMVETVLGALRRRRKRSATCGRHGTPAEVVLRILVLRHIKDWTFDQLEWEVRGNIAYRAFCRIDAHSVPDAKTMIRLERVLDGPHLRAIFERIVALGIQRRASRGTRARIDTTVVEAPIRHPTDSRLLEDAVRVLSRHIRRIARGGVRLLHPPRDRKRSIQRRARAIAAILRQRGDKARRAIVRPYRELMVIARSVIRDARDALDRAKAVRKRMHQGACSPIEASIRALETFIPRASSVVRQTRARIIRGITNSKDKLISIFEPYAQILRRGKPHKPTEFGLLVKIQESDGGLVTDVGEVPGKADAPLLVPSIERHIAVFGHAPRLAATDRGFYSDEGEAALKRMGLTTAAIPKPGYRSAARIEEENRRAFRRARAWRAGGEARIAHLKHDFGMHRTRCKGPTAIFRTIHWASIANNLNVIARREPP